MHDVEHDGLSLREDVERSVVNKSVKVDLQEVLGCLIQKLVSYTNYVNSEVFGGVKDIERSVRSNDQTVASFKIEVMQSDAECGRSSETYYCKQGIGCFIFSVDGEEVEIPFRFAIVIVDRNIHFDINWAEICRNLVKNTTNVIEISGKMLVWPKDCVYLCIVPGKELLFTHTILSSICRVESSALFLFRL